jgi:hypothetical protein
VQSLFFSPKEPVNGWIVGAGPVFLVPTGSDDLLTAVEGSVTVFSMAVPVSGRNFRELGAG